MIEWIQNNWDNILTAIGAFYALATAIALITPTDKDNTILDKIGAIADKLGWKIKGK